MQVEKCGGVIWLQFEKWERKRGRERVRGWGRREGNVERGREIEGGNDFLK